MPALYRYVYQCTHQECMSIVPHSKTGSIMILLASLPGIPPTCPIEPSHDHVMHVHCTCIVHVGKEPGNETTLRSTYSLAFVA